ncbi:MAG: hypothetical protein AB8B97_22820 [Granulosicoccus sp.]
MRNAALSDKSHWWHGLIGRAVNVGVASCITYALASIAHSQYVVAQVERMGVGVAFADRLSMTLGDLAGLYLYAAVITVGLVIGWLVMAGIRRLYNMSRWIVYPMGGLLTMVVIMAAMSLAFPMTPIAPARDVAGILGQCIAGLTGGFIFAWLQTRNV